MAFQEQDMKLQPSVLRHISISVYNAPQWSTPALLRSFCPLAAGLLHAPPLPVINAIYAQLHSIWVSLSSSSQLLLPFLFAKFFLVFNDRGVLPSSVSAGQEGSLWYYQHSSLLNLATAFRTSHTMTGNFTVFAASCFLANAAD